MRLAEVSVTMGEGQGSSETILSDPLYVLPFCRACSGNKSLKIVDISLLEPYRRGKIKTWRWTSVLNIRLYVEDDVEIPVYFTNAGESAGLTPEEAKQKMKSIHKARPRREAA